MVPLQLSTHLEGILGSDAVALLGPGVRICWTVCLDVSSRQCQTPNHTPEVGYTLLHLSLNNLD